MTEKLVPSKTSKSVAGLFVSNLIAFIVTGISYVVYSKNLTPSMFGLYSIALVLGSFGTLVLDGGLKNTIIKLKNNLNKEEEGVLLFLMVSTSILAVAGLILIYLFQFLSKSTSIEDYQFLSFFGGIYWISYPWIAIPTATLERSLSYTGIAVIESVGIILERALPAIFILSMGGGMYSFIWSLLISRIFRVVSMNLIYKSTIRVPSWKQIRSIYHLLSEGGWLQIAVGLSLLRDNLHTILVGLMFGKEWVGFYSWALQLSAISSQVFVQIAARVSIPVFAKAYIFEERWEACLYQIKLLTITISPILSVVLLIIPYLNQNYFDSKWTASISLLPFLFLRMLPGVATTPLGSMLMVQKGGRVFANAMIVWTLLETLGAYLLLKIVGPMGLAYSYAIIVWLGLYTFLYFLDLKTITLLGDILKTLLIRNSIFLSALLSTSFYFYQNFCLPDTLMNVQVYLVIAVIIVLLSYLSEKEIRTRMGITK